MNPNPPEPEQDISRPQSEGTPTTAVSPDSLPPQAWTPSSGYTAPPPAERQVRRPQRIPLLGPILLIGLGVVFLLNNLEILPWGIWGELWRLWPLILIAIGVDLVMGRRAPFASFLIVLLAFTAGLALLYANGVFQPPGNLVSSQLNVPLSGAKQAKVVLDFGAGELNVGSLSGEAAQFATGTLQHYENRGVPEQDVTSSGDTLSLEVKQRSGGPGGWWWGGDKRGPAWNVQLNRRLPIDLEIDAGASNGTLDLEALQVTSLKLDVGASDFQVIFPSNATKTTADINAGAASLDLVIPQGVGARIKTSSSRVSSINVIDPRFTKKDDETYETAGYEQAARKLEVVVDAGAASIDISSNPRQRK